MSSEPRLKRMLLVGYGVLLLAALGSYALLGWHVRMLADDYCQFGVGLHHGPIGAVILFSSTWNFAHRSAII